MRLVRQQDRYGCALACLAMVLDRSYEAVRSDFGDPGFGHVYTTWMPYLAFHGWAVQAIFRHDPVKVATRDPWPLAPWADLHLCSVDAGHGEGSHLVVMDRGGGVHDPAREGIGLMSDYPSVSYICGLFDVGALPDHRRS